MLKLIRSEAEPSEVINWNYFVAFFECQECGKRFYLTTRSLLKSDDAIERRLINLRCPKCLTYERPKIEDIIPLPINHLEEFIIWTC